MHIQIKKNIDKIKNECSVVNARCTTETENKKDLSRLIKVFAVIDT